MDLLPRTHHEFGSKDYWEKFFRKRGTKAFEWYGEFTQLCGTLTKYVRPADSILVAGCGNSDLSAGLYDIGFNNITNVDISDTVIEQMIAKHAEKRPDMTFVQMDLLAMSFPDAKFSVVLDKGTVDALFTDTSEAVLDSINKLLAEVSRVLRVGGRFVCISLAQEHIVSHLVRSFANESWMIRICRIPDFGKTTEAEFALPVFAFVFTKFRKMPNAKLILELAYFEDKPERFESVDDLLRAVRELQHYAMVRQQLKSGNRLDEQISLDLYSASLPSVPRYTVHVVDGARSMPIAKKFAVFIVPQGREAEWMFSSDEGRKQLHRSAGYERLLVVTLHRGHQYESLDSIKAELNEKVLEFAPPNVAKQSPFLSIGEDVNVRNERYRGTSALSGEYVVEDVDINGQVFRRLIFLSNKSLVQSEARMIKETNRKKGGKGKKRTESSSSCTKIDHQYLASNYYGTIVAGFSFVESFSAACDGATEPKALVIGLGGGGLPMFLYNNFTKLQIEVVEIDPAIVTVATDWFDFVADNRLTVKIADGLDYVHELSVKGIQQDVVILDVDSKNVSTGMSCPPVAFTTDSFLKDVLRILKPTGVMMLNLVCRSTDQRQAVIESLKSLFSHVMGVKLPDDVNETLYCLPTERANMKLLTDNGKCNNVLASSSEFAACVKALQHALDEQVKKQPQFISAGDNLHLASKLEKLSIL